MLTTCDECGSDMISFDELVHGKVIAADGGQHVCYVCAADGE